MPIAPAAASAAYQAMAKIGGTSSAASGAASTQGFGDFLSHAMKDAIGSMKAGETAAAQQAAGTGDIVNVVNAVNQAEITLDTVVAVRDKVIQAYQSIMQMPI
ncbi:MAG TPA: flagellar hook-basal body complex protein FliE [Rhizomicrobium sp.]|nr:flagellar hook-basal body complex protein FliE [Rhizomicrobium sp.]